MEALHAAADDLTTDPASQARLAYYPIDFRFNEDMEGLGEPSGKKAIALLGYLTQAIRARFRYRLDAVYYVPTPPNKPSLYRDWLVISTLRLFYPRVILHWHALGLGTWAHEKSAHFLESLRKMLTRRLFRGHFASLALSDFNRADAEKFQPKRILVLNNGIDDPLRERAEAVLAERDRRLAARQRALQGDTPEEDAAFHIVFCSNCFEEKGVLDVVRGAVRLARELRFEDLALPIVVRIAGGFPNETERNKLETTLEEARSEAIEGLTFEYLGFLGGEQKDHLLARGDAMLLPSYYGPEGQPIVLIESMAYGLPVVATRWRGIPELLGADYPYLVPPKDPEAIAQALRTMMSDRIFAGLRKEFLQHYEISRFKENLLRALTELDRPA